MMSTTTVLPSNSASRNSPGLFLTPTPPESPLHPNFSATASNGLSYPFGSEGTPPPELPTWVDFDVNESPASHQDAPFNAPKYSFRPGPRNPDKVVPLTWIDNDLTETYDPNARHDPYLRPPNQILPKRPKPDRPFNYSEYKAKQPKLNTWQQGRLQGQRLPVTLKFISDQARTKLEVYGESLDNWPEGSFILPDGEPDWEGWWASRGPVPESEFFYDLSTSYYFRDRNLLASKDRDANDEDLTVEDLSLGHPEARGCKACFLLGHECPLLSEGVQYPCECCVEDGIECELILEPPLKARCTSCVKRRIVCQFVTSPNTRGSCKACLDSSLRCVAGPKGGRTRTGPCLDKPIEEYEDEAYNEAQHAPRATKKRGKPRAACIECATSGQYCTLTGSKTTRPPCDRCFATGIPCTYDPEEAAFTTKRARRPARRIVDHTLTAPLSTFIRTPNYTLKARPAYHPPPQTSALKTRLGHPISFNVEDEDCNWCTDLLYGLLGLQTQTIRVLTTRDGYIPVQPPGTFTSLHCPDVEKPHPPSNMCSSCTLSRLAVLACDVHFLVPISGMEDGEFECSADEIIDFLEPGGIANLAPWEWCAICPSPASYRCSGGGPGDGVGSDGQAADGDSGNGCGLSLCSNCAVKLVTEHQGKLDALIQEMKAEDDGLGVRADVEMIHPAGELLRRMSGVMKEGAEVLESGNEATRRNREHSVGWGEATEAGDGVRRTGKVGFGGFEAQVEGNIIDDL